MCDDEDMTWRSKYERACVDNFRVGQKMSIGGNGFLMLLLTLLHLHTNKL